MADWRSGTPPAARWRRSHAPIKYVRTLRNIKTSDTGKLAFEPTTRAEVGKPSESTMSFSLSWSPTGESGRLTKDGLEVGGKTFARR